MGYRYLAFHEAVDAPSPMLILTDNLNSWISSRIKHHTQGDYSHAMWLYQPCRLATQGLFYHEQPLIDFLQDSHRVKFWWNPNWTLRERSILRTTIRRRLSGGWYSRLYDSLGIVGQYVGLRWINSPIRMYCSESASHVLRKVVPELNEKHPSPADLDRWCKERSDMAVWGVYDPHMV